MSLLSVENLDITFGRRRIPAVRGVSFSLDAGERLGLIGESGSGKSVTALAVMGLLPENAHVSGSVAFKGREVVGASDKVLSDLRGDEMTMVFQEPMTALDPTMTAGRQVAEVVRLHAGADPGAARQRVLALLDEELDAAGAACLFISHDLAVVSQVCDQVMVMWRGEIVETGSVAQVLGDPRHGYTRGLVATARLDLARPGSRLPVVEDYWTGGGRP